MHSVELTAPPINAISDAACYFPLANGRYEVKPGLLPLGTDLGNNDRDRQVFQIDQSFLSYRQAKLQARTEQLSKYYQTWHYNPILATTITRWLIDRLLQEHPQHFQTEWLPHALILHCQPTGERLYFDDDWQFQPDHPSHHAVDPPYVSALDALMSQVQEDLTVISRTGDRHWLSAIHLCYPNHWSAEAKIGKDFATIHDPVAGMAKINQRSAAIVQTMITRPPMVRFAWGLSTDTRLNHHPIPPIGISLQDWQGRHFDPHQPRLFLRIERQVIWGFPDHNAAVFTIRTYFRDCHQLKQDKTLRSQLIAALHSMSPESLTYKGLADCKDKILTWLDE